MTEFWMVYVAGGNSPTYCHKSEESARAEAARLAKMAGARKVYVLKAIACCEYQPIVWTEAEDGKLPF